MIPLVPMFHAHGWSLPYMATLLGCRQVYPGRFDPTGFLQLLEQEKDPAQAASCNACHPPGHGALPSRDSALQEVSAGHHLRGRRLAHSQEAGPAGPGDGHRRVRRLGHDRDIHQGGPAILKPHMYAWPEEDQLDFLIRTGMAVPLVEQRVVDQDMHDVPQDDNSIGEIVLRAPWLTAGYYKDPRCPRAVARRVAALRRPGHINQEASVLIADRNKDVIKSAASGYPASPWRAC